MMNRTGLFGHASAAAQGLEITAAIARQAAARTNRAQSGITARRMFSSTGRAAVQRLTAVAAPSMQ
jgi:hypothetical protein